MSVDLSTFSNNWYQPGGFIKRGAWYICNIVFLKNSLNPSGKLKIFILKLFGAKIGNNVVIKQSINIKYPWFLEIGDNTWIGEEAWIDNLGMVKIGANVCISQGALLLCGNHNYKSKSFDLMVGEIILEDGAWIGAKTVVTGGVRVASHAVLSAGSIANSNLEPYKIYQGNPAIAIRDRKIDNNE
ncbi:WcaF family extracellular polysaccharide biosynthesis acetyltransferase [Crocinitomix catalasitica]|uniref:WcaF family extracellular polysaccharide biosynthesis acetyltransferase n=1 Tax=Crocinitomix catalasitica TaxID=184607 RepID=UPI0004846EAF|nr:WcaF family extracellular polysaccharide biosynthesis acetyltransferase [Crocinitomix catalasitica]|tara:strand:+ start:286 stop:840 length:555 start_codon:yes stop_codon:yes gene_type:complete